MEINFENEHEMWSIYFQSYDNILNNLSIYGKLQDAHLKAYTNKPIGRFLDIGAGTGNFIKKIAYRLESREIYAIDYNEYALGVLKDKCGNIGNLHISRGDATDLMFPDFNFDAISMINVLYYVPDYKKALSELGRVACPGAIITISGPMESADIRGALDKAKQELIEKDLLRGQLQQDWEVIDYINANFLGESSITHQFDPDALAKELRDYGIIIQDIQCDHYYGNAFMMSGERDKS